MANFEGTETFFSDDMTNIEFSNVDVAFLMSILEKSSEEGVDVTIQSKEEDPISLVLEDCSSFDAELMESSYTPSENQDFSWIDTGMEYLSCSFPGDNGMINFDHFAEGFSEVIEFEGMAYFSQDCYENQLEDNVYSTDLWQ